MTLILLDDVCINASAANTNTNNPKYTFDKWKDRRERRSLLLLSPEKHYTAEKKNTRSKHIMNPTKRNPYTNRTQCTSTRHSVRLWIEEIDVNFIIHNILLRFLDPIFRFKADAAVAVAPSTIAIAIAWREKNSKRKYFNSFFIIQTRSLYHTTIKEPYVLGRYPSIVDRFVLLLLLLLRTFMQCTEAIR